MSTSANGTSPPASTRRTASPREQTPATRPVPRQSNCDGPPVRGEAVKPQAQQGRRSVQLTLFLMVRIPLAAVAGACDYARSQSYQSTDDAFIDGHIINVAPKVAGRVERVLVNDNQPVETGDLVVVLDNRDFGAARDRKRWPATGRSGPSRQPPRMGKLASARRRRLSITPLPRSQFDRFFLDEREGLVAEVAGGPAAVGTKGDGGGAGCLPAKLRFVDSEAVPQSNRSVLN
jgi:hypothetical protein